MPKYIKRLVLVVPLVLLVVRTGIASRRVWYYKGLVLHGSGIVSKIKVWYCLVLQGGEGLVLLAGELGIARVWYCQLKKSLVLQESAHRGTLPLLLISLQPTRISTLL